MMRCLAVWPSHSVGTSMINMACMELCQEKSPSSCKVSNYVTAAAHMPRERYVAAHLMTLHRSRRQKVQLHIFATIGIQGADNTDALIYSLRSVDRKASLGARVAGGSSSETGTGQCSRDGNEAAAWTDQRKWMYEGSALPMAACSSHIQDDTSAHASCPSGHCVCVEVLHRM